MAIDVSKLTSQQRIDLRARHTCIRDVSSLHCVACNHGVPYPALTLEEINDALGIGRNEREAPLTAMLSRPGRRR